MTNNKFKPTTADVLHERTKTFLQSILDLSSGHQSPDTQ